MEISANKRLSVKNNDSKKITRRKLIFWGTSSLYSLGVIANAPFQGVTEKRREIFVRNGWILLEGDLK